MSEKIKSSRRTMYGPPGARHDDRDYHRHRIYCQAHGFCTWEEYLAAKEPREDRQKGKVPCLSKKRKKAKRISNPTCMADIAAIVERNKRIVEEKLGIKLRRVA